MAEKSHKHRLKLKGSIGKGAFGEIYKGTLDGDVVAIKTMAKKVAEASQQAAPGNGELPADMFFREAEALRACSHKRIIGYRALMKMPPASKGSTEPMWALVMEYAKHGNLGQRVVDNMIHPGRTSYTLAQALGWALDVASALEYLHMRSPAVLHRDVKSANIMLSDEDGVMVAKLSDFGLHVMADDKKPRALQTSAYINSSRAALNGPGSVVAGPMTPSLSSRTPDSSGHTHLSSSSSAAVTAAVAPVPEQAAARPPLQPLNSRPAAAAAAAGDVHNMYTEVHDSEGSRVYMENSTAGTLDPARAQQAAANKSNSSFRRALHHPPGEALPRLVSNGTGSFTAAALDLEAAADANARLFAHWRGSGGSTDGSMCSMVTEGTWATQGTAASCTDTAGSDCTDDTAGSILEEVETVFNMTGRTGSCLYMAPEVYLAHNYNEKSDVFSFGVVLYELFAKCLVVFTELPTNSSDPEAPQHYAHKVAGGYRPARPKNMADNVWALITACWQQDPVLRPHMSEVVAVLSAALQEEVSSQLTRRKPRNSFGVNRKSTPSAPAAAPGGGLSTVSETGASGRRSVEDRHPKVAGAEQGSQQAQGQGADTVPAASQGCCVIA